MHTSIQDATPRPHTAGLVSGFLDSIQEPRTPYISPKRFAEKAGLRLSTLARLAGVHRNTLRQNPASEPLQTKLQEMIKVIAAAVELTGDVDRAIYWFRNEPIADYRHKTAAELVAEGHLDAVLTYLDDLKNGASG
jgi:lambda repressor-like predicted transcriptional regulator